MDAQEMKKVLDLIKSEAKDLRAAGVRKLDLGGVVVELADPPPPDPAPDEKPTPPQPGSDPLGDSVTYGYRDGQPMPKLRDYGGDA